MAGPRSNSVSKGFDSSTETFNVTKTYLHELGSDGAGEPIEEEFTVPARRLPTRVTIRSQVVGLEAAKQVRSNEFMASLRRRHSDSIAKMIGGLVHHADQSDFPVYTFPVFSKIKELLELLQSAPEEGNSRLILRLIRDSFMNGRWERYRASDVRMKLVALIEQCLVTEAVTMAHTDAVFNTLLDLGFDLSGAEFPILDEVDDKEEIEIPD